MGSKLRRTTFNARAKRLTAALERRADPDTKAWWERYLRGVIGFHGVRMATIRRELNTWLEKERAVAPMTPSDERQLASTLLMQPLAEDKLAGILFYQEVLLPNGHIVWRRDLPRMATLFDAGSIADWSTCDWFCVKVLSPLVVREGLPCATAIAAWSEAENLWRRRAAVVSFVNLAKHGDANFTGFTDLVLDACGQLVKSSEQFAQTGAAWVLRELSLVESDRVAAFLRANLGSLPREGVRSATAKMTVRRRTDLLEEHDVLVSTTTTRLAVERGESRRIRGL